MLNVWSYFYPQPLSLSPIPPSRGHMPLLGFAKAILGLLNPLPAPLVFFYITSCSASGAGEALTFYLTLRSQAMILRQNLSMSHEPEAATPSPHPQCSHPLILFVCPSCLPLACLELVSSFHLLIPGAGVSEICPGISSPLTHHPQLILPGPCPTILDSN